ncbi:MAG: P-loop NTPase fold protein, partial [Verrucomicrobiota bacterium]
GVFGDWGSGKTSIMKMLEAKLEDDESVAVLYFDAWLFEGYDDAKSALISSIIDQLVKHRRFPKKAKAQAVKLLKRVNVMRLLKMGWDNVALPAVLAYASGGVTAVPSVMGTLSKVLGIGKGDKADDSSDSVLKGDSLSELINDPEALDNGNDADVRSFRADFEKLLKETEFKAVVVLIDDVDRCTPARLVENLEAIKLFLNVNNTAFVIGADQRIVRHAIAVRYEDALKAARSHALSTDRDDAGEQLIQDYVEKLVQIPYQLPRLSPSEIETYLTLLFAQKHLDSEQFEECLSGCRANRASNRFQSYGLGEIESVLDSNVPDELRAALSFASGAASLITEHLKGNPRQVKRFLNSFMLRTRLAEVSKMIDLKEAVLLKLMLLEYSNQARFRELATWHLEQQTTPTELQAMESGKDIDWPEGWEAPAVMGWIQMEPKLSQVDLGDYFWLARDRLASSLVGLTLVAPVVRTALDALLSETGRKRCKPLLDELRADEFDSLSELLVQELRRDPKGADGYLATIECARHHGELTPHFVKIFKSLGAKNLPAFLAPKLEQLALEQTTNAACINSFLDSLKEGKGKIATAAKQKRGKK